MDHMRLGRVTTPHYHGIPFIHATMGWRGGEKLSCAKMLRCEINLPILVCLVPHPCTKTKKSMSFVSVLQDEHGEVHKIARTETNVPFERHKSCDRLGDKRNFNIGEIIASACLVNQS